MYTGHYFSGVPRGLTPVQEPAQIWLIWPIILVGWGLSHHLPKHQSLHHVVMLLPCLSGPKGLIVYVMSKSLRLPVRKWVYLPYLQFKTTVRKLRISSISRFAKFSCTRFAYCLNSRKGISELGWHLPTLLCLQCSNGKPPQMLIWIYTSYYSLFHGLVQVLTRVGTNYLITWCVKLVRAG